MHIIGRFSKDFLNSIKNFPDIYQSFVYFSLALISHIIIWYVAIKDFLQAKAKNDFMSFIYEIYEICL